MRRALVAALSALAALAAWAVLVYAAVGFGSQAREGRPAAWVLLGLCSVAAAACLFTGLLLAARTLAVLRLKAPLDPPPRERGGRRAAR